MLRRLLGLSLALLASTGQARAATYGHAVVSQQNGYPVLTVDGKPFFPYGAAFFYERLPRDMWRGSMARLRAMGVNTLDLYVPWNWHEIGDGDFDFTGRTNPRRDLRYVTRLAREFGFKILLRPGPVIRNEWRNGGYPAWLLEKPAYGMPLHDLLEGRYPPTATLQNARSDDAAAQWMDNPTHMRYARRWLTRVLQECAPVADLVLAVQLDDDQGAYIDNQTWPAPHLQAYLRELRSVVQAVTGPAEPVFINTYDMKVTASSPVWAMGNWYQSDTYAIGEHDRAELAFATGLLQTQAEMPLMYSEFQAGWLQQPGDLRPRAADPANTLLAMGTLLSMGAHGIVNFPVQDTLAPAGMEAPFSNAFYAWDAALTLNGSPSPRYAPTRRIGNLLSAYGPQLAGSHLLFDAGIAYLASAFDEKNIVNEDIARVAALTRQAQRTCVAASLSCGLIDLRYASDATLRRYPLLIVPMPPRVSHLTSLNPSTLSALARYARGGGIILATERSPGRPTASMTVVPTLTARVLDETLRAARRERVIANAPGAAFAVNPSENMGFFILPNYDDRPRSYDTLAIVPDGKHRITLRNLTVPARDIVITPLSLSGSPLPLPTQAAIPDADAIDTGKRKLTGNLPIRDDQSVPNVFFPAPRARRAQAFAEDVYRDGDKAIVLQNAAVRVIVSPNAGARAFVFQDVAAGTNIFTTVGAMRDDVSVEPPLSTTDKIAKYTHQFPAGMFNRPYRAEILANKKTASARFSYDAPDVIPSGARFARVVSLEPDERFFTVDETATFPNDDALTQRAVSVTSLALNAENKADCFILAPDARPCDATQNAVTMQGNALGFYNSTSHELATIAWRTGDVENARIFRHDRSIVVRMTEAPKRTARFTYGYLYAPDLTSAEKTLANAAVNVLR